MTNAIELNDVAKAYGPVRAVTGVDLAVPRGQAIALLGPNGAGKSTTISLLLGLLAPDRGRARLFGQDPQAAIRAGRAGVLPQDGKLIPRVQVGELVDFIRRTYPEPLPLAEAMAGLSGLAGRKVDELSGGQDDLEIVAEVAAGDQVVLAALAERPDIAVLDIELPGCSGLDAAAELRTAPPQCRVLIITTFGRPGYLRRAMEAGAGGFVVKDGPVQELAVAIQKTGTRNRIEAVRTARDRGWL